MFSFFWFKNHEQKHDTNSHCYFTQFKGSKKYKIPDSQLVPVYPDLHTQITRLPLVRKVTQSPPFKHSASSLHTGAEKTKQSKRCMLQKEYKLKTKHKFAMYCNSNIRFLFPKTENVWKSVTIFFNSWYLQNLSVILRGKTSENFQSCLLK